jgi:hypothetical protein
MAAFRQHIQFSAALGVAYGVGLRMLGFDMSHCVMAGGLCGIAGMFPDLDSDSGRPVQEIFNIIGVIVSLFLFHRLRRRTGLEPEMLLVAATGCYLFIRFVVAKLFMHFTVHRGMFHSLPAALVAGLITYLVYENPNAMARLSMASGVSIGFLSHLLLDEIYSVKIGTGGISLKSSAGSAIKLFSSSWKATITCWSLLGSLGYVAGVQEGLIKALDPATHWLSQHVFNYTGIDLDGKSASATPPEPAANAKPGPLAGVGNAIKYFLPSREQPRSDTFVIEVDPPPPPPPPARLKPPTTDWYPIDPPKPPVTPTRWTPKPNEEWWKQP